MGRYACFPETAAEKLRVSGQDAALFTRARGSLWGCWSSHLAPELPAVPVQPQLCVVRLCVSVWRARQRQGRVRRQGVLGSEGVLSAELLRRAGVQRAEQCGRRRGHRDGQVRRGQGEALGGRLAQVHRLLLLRGRGGGGPAEVERRGATVAIDDFGFPDDGAIHHSGGGRGQGGQAISAATL